MLPTLLIWDFNGTIINDGEILVAVNNEMNRARGIPEISVDYYRTHFDHPPKPFYEKLGYDFSKENYEEISEQFLDLYELRQQAAPLTEHVVEAIRWAKEQGIPQIVLSAHEQQRLENHVERLGLREYFDHISGESSLVIGGKVDRAKALAESGRFDFSRAVLVGDTIHDYHAACAMNSGCILYAGGHQTLERLQAAGVPIIDSMAQLPQLLEQYFGKEEK